MDVSNQLLQAILDSSDDAVITKDLSGRITGWNAGAERMYGFKVEEVLGKPISILGPPGKWLEILPILKRIQHGDRIEHYETQRRHRDGQILWVSISISPLKDDEGAIVGAVTIERDVSARRLMDRGANVALPSDADVSVIHKDLKGIVRHWSDGAAKMFGYSAEEMVDKPVTVLMPPDHRDDMSAIIERIKNNQIVHEFVTQRITKSGDAITVSIDASPLTDHGGGLIGVRSVARQLS